MACIGAMAGAVVVLSYVRVQPQPCCSGDPAYVTLYRQPLSRVDAVLAEGDGQAFAALARDPLLERPAVMAPGEYAYRAQRPVWGYVAWAGSLGQPELVGWVFVALTILSCGAACAVAAFFLLERGASPWWSLLVPLAGFETLVELTPELLAFALLGAGILLWGRDRRLLAVLALSLAVLTRETMLVGVAALGAYELVQSRAPLRTRARTVVPLLAPFLAFAAWLALLELRLGHSPFERTDSRLGLPVRGLVIAMGRATDPVGVLLWALLGLLVSVAAVKRAPRDVLAFVAVGFALFGSAFGYIVWLNGGFARTLIPLFVWGAIAVIASRAPVTHPITPRSDRVPTPAPSTSREVERTTVSSPITTFRPFDADSETISSRG